MHASHFCTSTPVCETCLLPTAQILCDPAKLVLTKSPGACTHKYKSASSWVGKECKFSGGAGFSDELTIGGDARSIPLVDFDVNYSF